MPEKTIFNPAMLETHCVIDCRTPLEYSEDHLPGAMNVPVLTDEERVEIGILHKQAGPQQARMRALELTCGRFAEMVHQVAGYADGKPILVYCWRGGLRSLAMATILEMTGYPVVQLTGGYKAFRNHATDFFDNFTPPVPLVIMHGMTGSGKTTFINGLDRKNWNVIDLEGFAHHRGSAFGSIGLLEQPSQKHFDTLLWNAFRMIKPDLPIILEGESQRIGRISLPGRLYQAMSESIKIWCNVSLETRVTRLAAEYARTEYQTQMSDALERIKKKLGGTCYGELKEKLEQWDVEGLARGLMEHYYDKLYYKHRPWTPQLEIDLEDFSEGEKQLKEFLDRLNKADNNQIDSEEDTK